MKNDLENKLRVLKIGYLEKMRGLVIELKNQSEIKMQSDIDELYSKIHKVSGTSGMYGLNKLSDISTEFELYLKNIKNDLEVLNNFELKEKLIEYIVKIEIEIMEG